jgi:hypothetical protein
MNIQDWLTQLLARPAADPLDWESYSVTMEAATWKALWRDIDATQAYEDGLEAGFRLLLATHQHRSQLRPKDYHARQVLLYGSILAMLDKADRWEAYLAAWETIREQTRHCVPARGNALKVTDPLIAAFVQRADGGFGVPPLQNGMSLPKPIAVHFLYPHLRRKTLIERKLEQERTGRLVADRRPMGRNALTVEAIQSRLGQLGQTAP